MTEYKELNGLYVRLSRKFHFNPGKLMRYSHFVNGGEQERSGGFKRIFLSTFGMLSIKLDCDQNHVTYPRCYVVQCNRGCSDVFVFLIQC